MISAWTKPGTKVVCVDDSDGGYISFGTPVGDMDGLTKDAVYTVQQIVRDEVALSGFVVILREIVRIQLDDSVDHSEGFDLRRFRYLNLPDSITRLLNTAPVDVDAGVSA